MEMDIVMILTKEMDNVFVTLDLMHQLIVELVFLVIMERLAFLALRIVMEMDVVKTEF
jgi:hypothetical protein